MFEFPLLFLRCQFAGFQSHSALVFENLALRHQLAVLKRQARKPKLRCADCFGLACGAFGPSGNRPCCCSNPKPLSAGTGSVFVSSGVRNPEPAQEDPPWIGAPHADSTDVAGQSDVG